MSVSDPTRHDLPTQRDLDLRRLWTAGAAGTESASGTPVKPFTPARREPGKFIPCSMCDDEPICVCAASMT